MSTVGEAHVINVLVVDGDRGLAAIGDALAAASVARFEVEWRGGLGEAIERVRVGGVDVVLLELALPDSNGLESLVRLRAEAPTVPIVVHTDLTDEVVARAAVNVGAQDYVVKGTQDPTVLARTLRYAVDRQGIVDELSRARRELARSLEETKRAYRKEQRTALRLQEVDQLKNDFVGIASHDLRAPLTVIEGYTRLMLDDRRSLDDAKRNEFLQIILRHTEDMRLLINDILDVSAIDSGSLTLEAAPFDLVDLVRTTAGELAVGANRTCTVDAPATARHVLGDARRHRQILANLVTNATSTRCAAKSRR
jgi:signal transduction histidine kinase